MTGSTGVTSRRTFLRDLGHRAFALTVIGLAGCAPRAPASAAPSASFDPLTYVGNLDEIEAYWCSDERRPASPDPPVLGSELGDAEPSTWARIGFVGASAYILVRGGEATVVDTGPWCTHDVIEDGLTALGLDWSAVGSVVVTHKHPDHWMALTDALERASDAVAYAGAADIPHIASPRPIVAVGVGDRVMDLAIIPTPGHTPGHISVHDEAAGVLVAGDTLGYDERQGIFLLPTSEDLPQAETSLGILAGLPFDTLLPSHGDAIVGGAWEELTEYIAGG